jgi:hypothetical protein
MALGRWLAAGVCLVAASGAAAHPGAPSWSSKKTERNVVRDATVSLSAASREALQQELLVLIPRFRTLENLAWDVGDHQAASRIHNIRYRYSTALGKVRAGLRITSADCDGTGAGRGGRFTHFRCSSVSEVLAVPTVEVVYGDGDVPDVEERKPRTHGPLAVDLEVHVTRRSSITYRQLGEAAGG